jgi:hydrophobic/amphiphilic exporter-1 (mainly G- bacteria), HAE1 family
MLSRFFIQRPVFAAVISILIVLLGAVAYIRLPRAQYPELAPPVVRVEAIYPGANAETIANTVASPIEQQINGVDGMLYMQSTAVDGRYWLEISFEVGTNIDIAQVLVNNRVGIAEPKLPEEVRRQGVTVLKQSTNLAGVISLSSPPGQDGISPRDDLFLSNYLTINWRDEFARIPGVGAINIIPAKEYGMRLWLDPQKLKARNLSVNDVVAAVRAQNVQVAAGKIGAEPAPAGTDFELTISTKGRLTTPEEFSEIIIKSEDRRLVRVRDVARTELGARDYSTISRFNGNPNAVMVIYQLPGANLVELTDAISAKLEMLQPSIPEGTQAKFFYDSSMFIKAALSEVFTTLYEAALLVFLVVLLFLGSLRTTLIPAITIPVSLIGTFLLMYLFGFSVNMLTMFGLVLAIGIVVDDAIVVVENVERNMKEYGLSPREATIKAMGEISGAVIAITLVLMSVFIPTAALSGITGEMYRQFALTIAASTALSAICALTLSPALCALLLSAHGHGGRGPWFLRPLTWVTGAFNAIFDRVTAGYAKLIEWSLKLGFAMLVPFIAILVGTGWMVTRVPPGFVPEEDLGFVVVAAQLPDGASLARSDEVINRVQQLIKGDGKSIEPIDGIKDVVTLSGFSVIDGNGINLANAWIVLEDWEERAKRGRSVQTIMGEINGRVMGMQEAQFLVFSLPAIPGLGNASAIDLRLQDRGNQGGDAIQSAVEASTLGMMGQQPPTIAFAFSSFRAGVPQLFLDVDREKAIKLNVPIQSVFETLQAYLGSAYVNDFNLAGRTWQVNVQAESSFRLTPDDVRRLEVRNADGRMVPLATLLEVQETFGPERVTRFNMYRSAQINGIPIPGVATGTAMKTMADAVTNASPSQMKFEWAGLSFQQSRASGEAQIVFALAILLVYLILAAQYESFVTPLAVILSIPLVIIGAMYALHYRGYDNNVFTQIGLVLLVGLGAKNAILIVEFARENRERGESIIDSALHAAKTRFRPIVMTSLAFVLGVVPLLTATGAGAVSRRSLGTAVFGGMVGNTILGLLLTPVLYVIVQTAYEWLRGLRSRPEKQIVGEGTAHVDVAAGDGVAKPEAHSV